MIRVATADDIPALAALCRDSFPDSPRWILRGGQWWSNAIACPGSETWVDETAGGVRGFVLLVLDERGWTRKMASSRKERIARGLSFVIAPKVLVSRARARLRPRTDLEVDAPGGGLPEHERLFIELIGVATQARGSGLGRALVAFGQRRAAELGLRGTYYRVDRRNGPMIALMRSSGLQIVRKDPCGYLFAGLVSCRDYDDSWKAPDGARATAARV